jgi:hypothetical protein
VSAGCQWLTPVILANQEAAIRRTMVRSQHGQIVRYLKKKKKKPITKKGLMWINENKNKNQLKKTLTLWKKKGLVEWHKM